MARSYDDEFGPGGVFDIGGPYDESGETEIDRIIKRPRRLPQSDGTFLDRVGEGVATGLEYATLPFTGYSRYIRDPLARRVARLQGLPVGDDATLGSMVRATAGLGATGPQDSRARRIAGTLLEEGTNIFMDPGTALGVGRIAGRIVDPGVLLPLLKSKAFHAGSKLAFAAPAAAGAIVEADAAKTASDEGRTGDASEHATRAAVDAAMAAMGFGLVPGGRGRVAEEGAPPPRPRRLDTSIVPSERPRIVQGELMPFPELPGSPSALARDVTPRRGPRPAGYLEEVAPQIEPPPGVQAAAEIAARAGNPTAGARIIQTAIEPRALPPAPEPHPAAATPGAGAPAPMPSAEMAIGAPVQPVLPPTPATGPVEAPSPQAAAQAGEVATLGGAQPPTVAAPPRPPAAGESPVEGAPTVPVEQAVVPAPPPETLPGPRTVDAAAAELAPTLPVPAVPPPPVPPPAAEPLLPIRFAPPEQLAPAVVPALPVPAALEAAPAGERRLEVERRQVVGAGQDLDRRAVDRRQVLMAEDPALSEVHADRLARAEIRAEAAEDLADSDPMTGLLNRRAHERYAGDGGHVSFDVSGLKAINDTHGHPAGDAFLKGVAEEMRATAAVRGVKAYRLGGDEFALTAPSEAAALEAARDIKTGLSRAVIDYKGPDGKILATFERPVIDYGYGRSFPDADRHLLAYRARAEARGERVPYRKVERSEPVAALGREQVPGLAPEPAAGRDIPPSVPGPREVVPAEPAAPPAAPEPPPKFASTQVNLPEHVARRVRQATKRIPDSALTTEGVPGASEAVAAGGREPIPHVTVKYGLHSDDVAPVREALAGEKPIRVTLGRTSIFKAREGSPYDVVKVDVRSPDLHRLNAKIAKLPHTDTHPDYKPHVTLAYVKPGLGRHFAGKDWLKGQTATLDAVTFSDREGATHEIGLGQAAAARALASAKTVATPEEFQAAVKAHTDRAGRIQWNKVPEPPRDALGSRILPGEEGWTPEYRKAVHETAAHLVKQVAKAERSEPTGRRPVMDAEGRPVLGDFTGVGSAKRGTALEAVDAGPREMVLALARDKGNPLELEIHDAARREVAEIEAQREEFGGRVEQRPIYEKTAIGDQTLIPGTLDAVASGPGRRPQETFAEAPLFTQERDSRAKTEEAAFKRAQRPLLEPAPVPVEPTPGMRAAAQEIERELSGREPALPVGTSSVAALAERHGMVLSEKAKGHYFATFEGEAQPGKITKIQVSLRRVVHGDRNGFRVAVLPTGVDRISGRPALMAPGRSEDFWTEASADAALRAEFKRAEEITGASQRRGSHPKTPAPPERGAPLIVEETLDGEARVGAPSKGEPGTPESAAAFQRAVGELREPAAVVSASGGKVLPGRHGGSGVRTTALAITIPEELRTRGWIDLRGHTLRTPQDVAVLARVYRDPRFETFRIFYTRSGRIVAHEGITSRDPTSVVVFSPRLVSRQAYEIRQRMERLQADGYWIAHNHPSGNPAPSAADLDLTRVLGARVKGLKGHVVIDHDTFGFIPPEGDIARGIFVVPREAVGAEEYLVPSLGVQPGGGVRGGDVVLRRPEQVAILIAALRDPAAGDAYVTLLHTDSLGRVRAVQEMPLALFEKTMFEKTNEAANYIRGRQRAFGAAQTFAYYPSSQRMAGPALQLMGKGVLRDAAFGDGEPTLYERGFNQARKSITDMKRIKVGEERPPLEGGRGGEVPPPQEPPTPARPGAAEPPERPAPRPFFDGQAAVERLKARGKGKAFELGGAAAAGAGAIGDAAVYGASLMERGIREFGPWSKAMREGLGSVIRDLQVWLRSLYRRATELISKQPPAQPAPAPATAAPAGKGPTTGGAAPAPTPRTAGTPGQGFSLPEETTLQRLQRIIQDRLNRVSTVTGAVKQQGGILRENLKDLFDAVTPIAADRIQQTQLKFIDPLVKLLAENKISLEDLDRYVYARHAPRRNKVISDRWEGKVTEGSGMSDVEAARILADFKARGLDANLSKAADIVREMREEQFRVLEDGGLLSKAQAKAWRDVMGDDYVPLRTAEVEEGIGTGRGFDIRGKESKSATGRSELADSPVSAMIQQLHRAIVRGEKNKADQAFARFAEENKLFELDREHQRTELRDGKAHVVRDTLRDAEDFHYKVDGEKHRLDVASVDPILDRALKNLSGKETGKLVETVGKFTRLYSQMVTSWNPEFLLTNFARDIQTAVANVSAERTGKIAQHMVKNVPQAVRGIYESLRNPQAGGAWANAAKEFRENGGSVGWFSIRDLETIERDLAGRVKRAGEGPVNAAFRAASAVKDWVERANKSVEGGVRLAYFQALRDAGVVAKEAAAAARKVTIDFNKKGEMGPVMNSLYAFFNANVQGAARLGDVLRTPRGAKIAGGIAASAWALDQYNRAVAGDSDKDGVNDYDAIPEYVKERNLVVMRGEGGNPVLVPLPYGFNVLHTVGRQASAVLSGATKPGEAALAVGASLVNAFNPLGSESDLVQQLAPTFLDPIVQHVMNRDFAGRKIRPDYQAAELKPDSENYYKNINPFARSIAEWLNEQTGGDKLAPGFVSVSPETLEHFAGFATGGLGRFVGNTIGTGQAIVEGKVPDIRNIPFARRFVYEPREFVDTEKVRADYREAFGIEPLRRAMVEAGYAPQPPARSITIPNSLGKKVELTPAEYRVFVDHDRRMAERLRTAMLDPRFRQKTPEAKRQFIEQRYQLAADDARRKVLPFVLRRVRAGGAEFVS